MSPADPRNNEEMTIRVLPDGRIVIDGSGLPPRRLRELQETLQETLGPARLIESEAGEDPSGLRLWASAPRDEDREQERN